jgi:hypothetical protein
MLTLEQTSQFSDILEEFGKALDITEAQHDAVVKSYRFVGEWLADEASQLARYKPDILPQGSFLFGTMTKPESEADDLDIDLVCRLEGKQPDWTQFNLKAIVGNRLKSNGILEKLVVIPDGRRCWTLKHAESAQFHMDILPAIVSSGYKIILEKSLTTTASSDFSQLAIRITDKNRTDYRTSTSPEAWLVSNPFGYGIWFEQRATIAFQKSMKMSEAVHPVPAYHRDKLPLQRVVQILKRHRDMMFNGDCDKPVSMIITTLAAKAYEKETNIAEALGNVIRRMPSQIEDRYSPEHRRVIKWVANPVHPDENFADKWVENPQKENNFYRWMQQVSIDVTNALQQTGLNKIRESLEKPFGEKTIIKAFGNYGEKLRSLRESGAMKMAEKTGILGMVGRAPVPQHSNFGSDE